MSSAVTCFLDLTDLSTYAAMEPILLLSSAGPITYLPLMVSLSSASGRKPVSQVNDPLAAYKARRQRARDSFALAEHQRLLALTGVSADIADHHRDGDLAHRTLYSLSVNGGSDEVVTFIRNVMTGTFQDGMEMDDPDWLRSISGILDPPQIPEAVMEDQMEQGIFKSPGWLVDGERYLGREHLPMVGHLLMGSPDVAPV